MSNIQEVIKAASGLVSQLLVVVVGIALAVFFWGLIKFMFKLGGDEKAVEDGKMLMRWGLIALFIMFSIYGIIKFFQISFGINTPPDNIIDPIDDRWGGLGDTSDRNI
jgi:hypothetical protein